MIQRSRGGIALAAAAAVLAVVIGLLVWRREPPLPAAAPAPVAGTQAPVVPPQSSDLTLPKKLGSIRFAVMGDTGRGDPNQYDTANQMIRWREWFDYTFVLMLGDNIYAAGTPENYAQRFERPYKALIDAGVPFHAVLGNHDPPGQADYGLFNMFGNRYYTFKKDEGVLAPVLATRKAQFFALDTVTLDARQLTWLRDQLRASDAQWKIVYYHHPLYTSGRYRLLAAMTRRILEPIFVQFGVDVALSGHEHFYERIVPQQGVQYFTSGGGGALRKNDIRDSRVMAAGFDQDTHFMLMEISGDTLYFQAISRTGKTVDAGRVELRPDPAPPPAIRR